ncbi:LysR family transcriptional regulator [Pseudomonas sp. NFXW11]|uniref:LysR family transcriptional regulator n=1 Tax=Pseudomonas sp. NFXW11 TaxID=2819531 RepID=UPI003CE911CC
MLTQLRDMDLQLLRLFVTIVECGGFSAAQGKLGLAQSTISTQMAKLEVRLGIRLCERGKSGFRLTPKGELVLASARRMLEALDRFTREARDVSQSLLGELHIGISERLAPREAETIARALGQFRQRAPEVVLEILSATPADLEQQLLRNQLQLAIGYFSGNQTALHYEPLFSERQSLYCGQGHEFFRHPPPDPAMLRASSQIARPYKTQPLHARMLSPKRTAISEQVDADLIFILSGAHLSFLPTHIAEPWVAGGKLRALFEDSLSYDVTFYLATSKSREPGEVLEVFKQHLLQAFKNP